MKLKVTLQRAGGNHQDLLVTADAAATVGDLATYLALSDPQSATGAVRESAVTIGLAREGHQSLDPRTPLSDSPIRSGAVIEVSTPGDRYTDATSSAVAMATVLSGPDTGREFPLAPGTNIIGRVRSSEVRLSDPLASRQHARLNVSDHIEVIDLGSANGVELNGSLISRELVRPTDEIKIGDTVLSARMVQISSIEGRTDSASVGFIRSPRLAPRFEGRTFEVPDPPQRQNAPRFPMAMLVAPLILAGVLWFVTKQPTSLIFAALSPVMVVGNFLEQRRGTRRADRTALAGFRADLDGMIHDAEDSLKTEATMRLAEHPSTLDCVEAAHQRTPLLWTRRPDDWGFLELRLGLAELPSRSTVVMPDAKRAPRELLAEANAAIAHLATIADMPVIAAPRDTGAIGIAGPRSAAMGVARALVAQAATLHSPAQLSLAVFASSRSADEWDWVKWLPHADAPSSPVQSRHLASTPSATAQLLTAVEAVLAERQEADRDAPPLPAVLLIVESDTPVEFGRLVDIAERGRPVGVHILWIAPEVNQLPATCRTFMDVRSFVDSGVGYVHTAHAVTPVAAESLTPEDALTLARSLAPVVDLGARTEDASDLPRNISFLTLDGHEHLGDQPEAVIERWNQNHSILTGPRAGEIARKEGSLRAVIGHAAGQLHTIDLRTDGPHALVGGTTGAGKSELLQTWILSLAASHSPQRLTFLLVDYKGGSAFADCSNLPHTVGLVTDLNPNGVRRALTSLSAELTYREKFLEARKAKDLMALEKKGATDAPPSLVIVVDEFAALVQEVPEFVDGVVNVAQRGRSLGLHLILATQRPAGVIKDNLRANTNLRLALRVADEADSVDVLGSPDAAFFDAALPGRAVSKTGPGRLAPFQTAYVGGHTGAGPTAPDIRVEELTIGTEAIWEIPESAVTKSTATVGPTDITRVVDTITSATYAAEIPPPRKPWLPDLQEHYDLADPRQVPSARRDNQLVFGILDDPKKQQQRPVAFEPDKDGNLAVFGTGGAGKSTLLRTLAAAAGLANQSGPCHVYGLDFGARGLSMLEGLPHVGSIVNAGDDERVRRLLKWVRDTIDERAARYASIGAGSIADYRQQSGRHDEARILVLLDGLGAFRSTYEGTTEQAIWELLLSVAADGRPTGVHFVVTADRPGVMPTALASSVQKRIVMRLADPGDYAVAGAPSDILNLKSAPGRAILEEDEVQVAILGPASDTKSQSDALAELTRAMVNARVPQAHPIRKLLDRIPSSTLPRDLEGRPVLGVASTDLEALPFDPTGTFVVVGPPSSGRTTALHTVAVALRRQSPTWVLAFLSPTRRSSLRTLSLWNHTAFGPTEVSHAAKSLADEITERYGSSENGPARVAIIIESAPDFAGTEAEEPLSALIAATLAVDGLVVSEGETSAMTSGFGLLGALKSGRAGIALQPDSTDGFAVFKTQFPNRLRPQDFPPGRGLLVAKGNTTVVQLMTPEDGT